MRGVEALRATKSWRSLLPYCEWHTPSLALARVLSTTARAVAEVRRTTPPLLARTPTFLNDWTPGFLTQTTGWRVISFTVEEHRWGENAQIRGTTGGGSRAPDRELGWSLGLGVVSTPLPLLLLFP